jgi:hypothetical protein
LKGVEAGLELWTYICGVIEDYMLGDAQHSLSRREVEGLLTV